MRFLCEAGVGSSRRRHRQSPHARYGVGGASGPHVHAGSGPEVGGSYVRAEGMGRATRPRDAGVGNKGGAGNGEARDSRRGRPDARALASPLFQTETCKIEEDLTSIIAQMRDLAFTQHGHA